MPENGVEVGGRSELAIQQGFKRLAPGTVVVASDRKYRVMPSGAWVLAEYKEEHPFIQKAQRIVMRDALQRLQMAKKNETKEADNGLGAVQSGTTD